MKDKPHHPGVRRSPGPAALKKWFDQWHAGVIAAGIEPTKDDTVEATEYRDEGLTPDEAVARLIFDRKGRSQA